MLLAVSVLLYTAIFYLVSIMSDLGELHRMQYLEGSSSLETEKRRVQLLMALFGGAYLLRGGFDLVIGIYLTEFE